jgi:hypothetical protein
VFTLRKSDKKASSRQQINIKGVRDGVLLLPNNQYRVALEVSSLNFELKSEAEQDALIDTYESFLNSLPCPLQIIVRIRELDMSKYLADLHARHADEKEEVYKAQLQNYSEFVQSLVEDNKILARRFYVVLPYGAKEDDFAAAKERLMLNADLIAKGLMRMGVQTRQLGSLEVLDLFHSFYNPAQAKRQPITESVARLLNSSYTRKGQA